MATSRSSVPLSKKSASVCSAALLSEFRADTGLHAPAADVNAPDDTCPLCVKPLVLVQLKALLTCPECGYATPYLDATTGNLSYSDDQTYDFTTFHCARPYSIPEAHPRPAHPKRSRLRTGLTSVNTTRRARRQTHHAL